MGFFPKRFKHIQGFSVEIGEGFPKIGLRAQDNDVMDELTLKVDETIRHLSEHFNVPIEIEWFDHVPAAKIDVDAEVLLAESIEEVLGEPAEPRIITPGSDDFHFYTIERPHLKATMLALGADVTPGLRYDAYMKFNHDAIEHAIDILTNVCLRSIKNHK